MKNQKQRGFTFVALLLILVIVAIISFASWYVYKSSQSTKKTLDNSVASVADPQKSTEFKNNTTSTQQKYLEISEWGVKLPLLSTFEDLRYTNIKKGDNEETTTLEKATIADKYSSPDGIDGFNSSCSGHLGQLIRFKNLQALTYRGSYRSTYAEIYPNAIKVGDYYYQMISSQSACGPRALHEGPNAIHYGDINKVIEGIRPI